MNYILINMKKLLCYDILSKYFFLFLLCITWFILSISTILFNKWILYYYGFPFPITLTLCHMMVGFLLSFFFCKICKWIIIPPNIDWNFIINRLLPIGFFFAMTISSSNAAYMYISVSFIQMLKELTTAIVLTISIIKGLEIFSFSLLSSIVTISLGVFIACYGTIEIQSYFGVGLQLTAVISEAIRLYFLQINLQGTDIKLNSITMIYFLSHICFCTLLVPFFVLEYEKLLNHMKNIYVNHNNNNNFIKLLGYLLLNGLVVFFLNLSILLFITKTSSLTLNVAGVVKNIGLIFLSSLLFHTHITFISCFGYTISILGLFMYIYIKYKRKQQKYVILLDSQNNDDEKDLENISQKMANVIENKSNILPFMIGSNCVFCTFPHK